MIPEQALRNLNNFLTSYTIQESADLLNQVYEKVTDDKFGRKPTDISPTEKILDFLESLEELVPAIYTLQSERSHLRE